MTDLLTLFTLTLLMIISLNIIFLKNTFSVIVNTSLVSLLSVIFYIIMDAVDVAFTETAVGVGISGAILLSTLSLTKNSDSKTSYSNYFKFFVFICLFLIGIIIIQALLSAPEFMSQNAPYNNDIYIKYISESYNLYHIPNFVTIILGSYRGYDTLGETTVIFTAALGVYIILSKNKESN
jgi:multicomponent Na+:H+ antiporter subunit B